MQMSNWEVKRRSGRSCAELTEVVWRNRPLSHSAPAQNCSLSSTADTCIFLCLFAELNNPLRRNINTPKVFSEYSIRPTNMRRVQGLPTDDRESGIRQAGGSGSLMRRGNQRWWTDQNVSGLINSPCQRGRSRAGSKVDENDSGRGSKRPQVNMKRSHSCSSCRKHFITGANSDPEAAETGRTCKEDRTSVAVNTSAVFPIKPGV